MTTANKITITRIFMIIPFIICAMLPSAGAQLAALILFCVASFTDFLDGYIARKYHQVTDFGKFVDPLADKLLVTAALVMFVERGLLSAWMVFVILARELIITSLRIVAANKGQVMAAAWSGKVKTCVQIAGIILLFVTYIAALTGVSDEQILGVMPSAFVLGFSSAVGWVMTLVTLYSGYDYLHRNWDLIKDGT